MNDSRIFLFLVGVLFSISANAQTRSILFIGNSYTYGNNMPAITASMAQSTGKTLNYDSHTPGGEQLASHASSTIVEDKLDDQDWDFVAIQGQSQEMSWPLVNSSSQMASCATLSQKARTAYSCVVPLFYMTWGRENGDAQNCGWQSYLCTYEGMDDTLQANYTRAATQNNGAVSPVAKVWRYLRANTSLDLYASDGSHASYAGSYAVAATFYTMIFQADPESVTFYGSLSAADAQEILSAVKLIVYDDLEDFFFTTSYPYNTFVANCSGTAGIDDVRVDAVSVFPNPSNGTFTISSPQPWKVLSLSGAVILEGTGSEINLTSSRPGVYFLQSGTQTLKLIVE